MHADSEAQAGSACPAPARALIPADAGAQASTAWAGIRVATARRGRDRDSDASESTRMQSSRPSRHWSESTVTRMHPSRHCAVPRRGSRSTLSHTRSGPAGCGPLTACP